MQFVPLSHRYTTLMETLIPGQAVRLDLCSGKTIRGVVHFYEILGILIENEHHDRSFFPWTSITSVTIFPASVP
jgi:hypothetical protein